MNMNIEPLNQTHKYFTRFQKKILSEVYFGAYKNKYADVSKFDSIVSLFPVFSFSKHCGKLAGKIRADLLTSGKDIGQMDCMIAATVLAHGCTKIVTRNTKHFERIPGIEVISY